MSDKPGPILITGANSGFGLAAALRFASRGWETWGTVRSSEKAELLTDAASKAGVGDLVRPTVLDVSDHEAVVDGWSDLPPFYGVVNNAGYSEMGAIEEVSAAEAKQQLDVNLIAPAIVASCALPAMRKRGSGRIVMVSSMFGRAAI
ncbi:MAG: SDR family NAD(P)-dependent oxidoreductase, partial [Actinomycetia bacterium]|nr:SDR family NAD(P)-dependent oxidoreductase [Actinomycetes bacterium]